MTYNKEAYLKYRAKRKRKYNVCQLIGCYKPLERNFEPGKRVNKFCCPEHAKLAAKQVQAMWQASHPERRKEIQKKYNDKKRKERLKLKQQHENQENKTN